MLHYLNVHGEVEVPICLINLDTEVTKVREGKTIALMKEEEINNWEITTETVQESICEVEDSRQGSLFYEQICKGEIQQGNFTVSPADILSWEKPRLKDVKVPEEWREKFLGIFQKYSSTFAESSADIGKTPIAQMEIDTRHNPPFTQRPYSLAVKYVEWVRQEIEALEKLKF